MREHRPGREAEAPLAARRILLEHVGARDVRGHQIRRELDAIRAKRERLAERRDEQRLGETRDADEEPVPAREERDEQQIDDVLLPDDALADLREDPRPREAEGRDALDVAHGRRAIHAVCKGGRGGLGVDGARHRGRLRD